MSIQSSDVVIIGGSIAGLRAAEAIVRHAPSLKITVVSDEPNPAYQRPPLSKIGLADSMDLESLTYPSVATLKDHGVVFSLGNRAESLDTGRSKSTPHKASSNTEHWSSPPAANP